MTKTSIRYHYRTSTRAGRHPGRLFIRVIRSRRSRHISTDYTLYPWEWDKSSDKVIFPEELTADPAAFHRLSAIEDSIGRDMKRLQEIVFLLDAQGNYTADDVVLNFASSFDRNTVCGYAENVGRTLNDEGRERTARAYCSAARSLMAFNGGADVPLSEIDGGLVRSYEQYLIGKGLKLNTVSFYLRNLRALYFRAIGEKLIPRQFANPFAGVHTGVYETRRRALDGKQLRALAAFEDILSGEPQKIVDGSCSKLLDSLRYFMFCYHARGMSFVDMAHLRKQDVGKGMLTYRRRKTGGMLEVKVTEPMKRILSHFGKRTEGSCYIFPVIDSRRGREWRQYETGLKLQNMRLKELARIAGITENISTHVARHTWATLAKRLNVPVAVISEALGHRDVKTTSIYLASFDRSTMDSLSAKMSAAARAA